MPSLYLQCDGFALGWSRANLPKRQHIRTDKMRIGDANCVSPDGAEVALT